MIGKIWNRRVGRLPFAILFVVVSGLVWLLPGLVNRWVITAFGTDPQLSAPRIVLRAYGSMVGLAVLSVPLVLVTRNRLRDLDLSGALLLITPLWALTTLMAYPAASLAVWSIPLPTPLHSPAIWIALACSVALMVLPGESAGGPPRGTWIERVRFWTTCDGTMDRDRFRKVIGYQMLVAVMLNIAWPLMTSKIGLTKIGSTLGPLVSLISYCVLVLMVSASVRRFHDLGHNGVFAVLFPLGLSKAFSLIVTAAIAPKLIVFFFASVFAAWSPVWGALSVLSLVYLLVARGENGSDVTTITPTRLRTI